MSETDLTKLNGNRHLQLNTDNNDLDFDNNDDIEFTDIDSIEQKRLTLEQDRLSLRNESEDLSGDITNDIFGPSKRKKRREMRKFINEVSGSIPRKPRKLRRMKGKASNRIMRGIRRTLNKLSKLLH